MFFSPQRLDYQFPCVLGNEAENIQEVESNLLFFCEKWCIMLSPGEERNKFSTNFSCLKESFYRLSLFCQRQQPQVRPQIDFIINHKCHKCNIIHSSNRPLLLVIFSFLLFHFSFFSPRSTTPGCGER